MRRASRGARARDTRDTPQWEVPIDQISTPRRVEAPIYTRARPQRPRLFSPATPWNTPFPGRPNTHLARGWEVRTPTGAVRTRCSAYLRQIRRRIRELSVQLAKVVGASASVCACDPVALPRRGSDLLLELRRERKFSSEWVLPDVWVRRTFVRVFSPDDLCDVFARVCKPTKSTRALDFGGDEIFARDVPFCMGI